MRAAVSGAGLPGNNYQADNNGGRHIKQQLPELLPQQGGRSGRAGADSLQGQFDAARDLAGTELPKHFIYAVETSVQLVMTERNEHLRELYIAAYTQPETVEYIYENMARKLKAIFGDRFPGYTEQDFYELAIGSGGLMCGYMAKPSSIHFPLERKIERFLTSSMRVYRVGEEELERVLTFVKNLDIESFAANVLEQLLTRVSKWFSTGGMAEQAG